MSSQRLEELLEIVAALAFGEDVEGALLGWGVRRVHE